MQDSLRIKVLIGHLIRKELQGFAGSRRFDLQTSYISSRLDNLQSLTRKLQKSMIRGWALAAVRLRCQLEI